MSPKALGVTQTIMYLLSSQIILPNVTKKQTNFKTGWCTRLILILLFKYLQLVDFFFFYISNNVTFATSPGHITYKHISKEKFQGALRSESS